jgi:hypothetical protein
MDSLGLPATAALQSGFVLAVILLAVFFAERLGGSSQLALRSFQVILGLALTFLVISGTTAFDRPPQPPEALQQAMLGEEAFGDDEEALEVLQQTGQETARNASEVSTIHAGLGVILVVCGLALLARLRVLPAGLVLGGLLLLLLGGPREAQGGLGGFYEFFSSIFGALVPGFGGGGGPGQARDIAHFGVLLFGTGALAALGFWRWERSEASTEPATSA